MSDYPTAEEELKDMTRRFWAQVEISEQLHRENTAARNVLIEWKEWWETSSVGHGQKGPIYTKTLDVLSNVSREQSQPGTRSATP